MRLLIVEDDTNIAALIARDLHGAGYTVDTAGLVESGLNAALDTNYAALVVDLRLPDGDGLDLVRRLRALGHQVPILILTGRRGVADRVAGLKAGADDYLVKPFAAAELRERLVALQRRARIQLPRQPSFADVEFDESGIEALVGRQPIALARQELRLLRLLVERGGHMVSKPLIEETLYGFDDDVASNAVEVHIHKLRRALSEAGSVATIETRRGLGYRLVRKLPQ
jgi:DNA-binding response OmpR family regulator